jgi:hypothetical protein
MKLKAIMMHIWSMMHMGTDKNGQVEYQLIHTAEHESNITQ